ncbi:hypothetical protein BSKO_07154 [Bryopsis sp. KO-2023]|nr:hypothetical protein BSKO_07154 [Bryopsis sp. KO-2023]
MDAGRMIGQKNVALPSSSQRVVSRSIPTQRQGVVRCGRLRNVACTASGGVQVSKQDLPNSRIKLILTVDPDFNKESYDKVLKEVRKMTKVKGFRQGKEVPLPLLYNAVGGEESFRGEVVKNVVERATAKALEEYGSSAIDNSDSLDTSAQDMLKSFSVDKPFVFDVSFDVLAPVKWKSPYKDIKVEVQASGNEESDKATVEFEIRQMLKQKAINRIVAHRGLENGDLAILDIDFIRLDRNESIPGMKQDKFAFDTDMKDDLKLFQYLEGIKIGEEREFNITFPDNWEPKMNRGVEAKVTVNCRELFEWEFPELNDEFVKASGADMTAEEFKEQLLVGTKAKREEADSYRIQDALCEALAEIAEMDVAESAIQETGKAKYQEELVRLQSAGKLTYEAVQQLARPDLVETYVKTHREELEVYQKAICALEAVGREEKLSVTKEELDEEFDNAKKDFEEEDSDFDPERLREICKEVLSTQKVVNWFKDNGAVTVLPPV